MKYLHRSLLDVIRKQYYKNVSVVNMRRSVSERVLLLHCRPFLGLLVCDGDAGDSLLARQPGHDADGLQNLVCRGLSISNICLSTRFRTPLRARLAIHIRLSISSMRIRNAYKYIRITLNLSAYLIRMRDHTYKTNESPSPGVGTSTFSCATCHSYSCAASCDGKSRSILGR